ncbi:unnamed protein product [Pylaiella littoralis]
MPSADTQDIKDPKNVAIINKIGAKRMSYLGALVQRWENVAVEGLSFTDWVMNDDFVEITKRLCNTNHDTVLGMKKDIQGLRAELSETKEELADSKRDIARLLQVSRDIYAKLKARANANSTNNSIFRVKRVLCGFNRENAVAVASGGGVHFSGFSKIGSLESLRAFLASMRARELGVPCNIIETYRVFVLDGRLVTLSDEYHGGVGYSFLWKKKKSSVGAVGWSTADAKSADPRLGVDPATGVNYVDPETGRMWVYPAGGSMPKVSTAEAVEEGEEEGEVVVVAAKKRKMSDDVN